jgi:magnesium chelatase family protein
MKAKVAAAIAFKEERLVRAGSSDNGRGSDQDKTEALNLVASKGGKTGVSGRDAALLASCALDAPSLNFLEELSESYLLSGRGIMRALGVARTIADLEAAPTVTREHLLEAVQYRSDNGV